MGNGIFTQKILTLWYRWGFNQKKHIDNMQILP